MSGIYKQSVPNLEKATLTLFSQEDKTVPMDSVTSDSIMLQMVSQASGNMKVISDTAFKIRAGRTKRSLYGLVTLDANLFQNKEITLPVFQNRNMWTNETLKALLEQWRVNPFTTDQWNAKNINISATDNGWIPLKGIVFLMYTTTYTMHGSGINGLWQSAVLQDLVKVLNTLIEGGYIPNIPLYLLATPDFYKAYPELSGTKIGRGILETGMFTEAPGVPFATMKEAFAFRPDDTYQYGYVPEGFNPQFCIYSQNRFQVSGFGQPISVGLWNDTAKNMGFGDGVVDPPVDPPIDPPADGELEARVKELEDVVAVLKDTVDALVGWKDSAL